MGNISTVGLGPPPLATPITGGPGGDQFGVPFQNRPDEPVASGTLAIAWAAWFTAIFDRLSGSPFVTVQTLTVASTTISPPATQAVEWVVVVTQDGTGGRAIVWGSGVILSSVNIDTTAGTTSVFRFVRATIAGADSWVLSAQPTTGML